MTIVRGPATQIRTVTASRPEKSEVEARTMCPACEKPACSHRSRGCLKDTKGECPRCHCYEDEKAAAEAAKKKLAGVRQNRKRMRQFPWYRFLSVDGLPARERGYWKEEVDLLHYLAWTPARGGGDFDEAKRLAEEGLAIAQRRGFRGLEANLFLTLGDIADDDDRHDEARRMWRRGARIKREDGIRATAPNGPEKSKSAAIKLCNNSQRIKSFLGIDTRSLLMHKAAALITRGRKALVRGDRDEAKSCYNDSLDISKRIHDRRGEMNALWRLGYIALDRAADSDESGDTDGQRKLLKEARVLYDASFAIASEIGDLEGMAHRLLDTGWVEHRLGNHDEALRLWGESTRMATENGITFTSPPTPTDPVLPRSILVPE